MKPGSSPSLSWRGVALASLLTIVLGLPIRLQLPFTSMDLEYDEGTATWLAARIASGEVLPLTGEKVYRGPILEYLVAGSFKLLGISTATARIPLFLAGLLVIPGLILLAWPGSGVAGALFLAVSLAWQPWWVFTASVVHSACLVPIFVTVFLLGVTILQKKKKHQEILGLAFLTGTSLGLAVHGHLYAVLLAIPVTWYVRKVRPEHFFRWGLFALAGLFLTTLPILIFNVLHEGASLRYFFSGAEGHSIMGAAEQEGLAGSPLGSLMASLWRRMSGFALTTWDALRGGGEFWLDTSLVVPRHPIQNILPLVVLTGFFAVGARAWKGELWPRFLLAAVLLQMVIIPLGTKHRPGAGLFSPEPSLPTYIDTLMPFLMLLGAEGGAWLWALIPGKRPRLLGAILLSLALLGGYAHTWRQVATALAEGGFGRWGSGADSLAQAIGEQASPGASVFAEVPFGKTFPQMATLLPGVRVLPVIQWHHWRRQEVTGETFLALDRRWPQAHTLPGLDFDGNPATERRHLAVAHIWKPWTEIRLRRPDFALEILSSPQGQGSVLEGWFQVEGEPLRSITNLHRRDSVEMIPFSPPPFSLPTDPDLRLILGTQDTGTQITGWLEPDAGWQGEAIILNFLIGEDGWEGHYTKGECSGSFWADWQEAALL